MTLDAAYLAALTRALAADIPNASDVFTRKVLSLLHVALDRLGELCQPIEGIPDGGPPLKGHRTEVFLPDLAWDWGSHGPLLGQPQIPPAQTLPDEVAGVLFNLTHYAAYEKQGDRYQQKLPDVETKRLRALPEAQQEEELTRRFAPIVFGTRPGEPWTDLLTISCPTPTDPVPLVAHVAFHPLIIDPDHRRAYYTVQASFVVDPAHPQGASATAADCLEALQALGCRLEALRALEKVSASPEATTSTTGTLQPIGSPVPASKTFPLAFGLARIDNTVDDFLTHAHRIRLPGQKWSAFPSWTILQKEEVDRIRNTKGEAAFQPSTTEGALLKKHYRDGGKTEVVELTAEALKALKIREGMGKGYRFLDRDGREYLVKLFMHGKGYLEVGLSWYGMAGPWVKEWQKELKAQTPSQLPLFDTLDPEHQERINRLVRQTQLMDDGRKLMEVILGQVGRQQQNPVVIPSIALKVLLQCEQDPNWKSRVEGGLNALRACEFRVNTFGMETLKGYGAFLGEWWYRGLGAGDHGAGDYYLHVQPGFVGCLEVFQLEERKLPSRPNLITYAFGKDLTKDQKKQLRGGGGYSLFDAGRPFINAAHNFTPAQQNLHAFLEREITKNGDPISKLRKHTQTPRSAPDRHDPRLYTQNFCPLLLGEHRYQGALGHFKRNPESGRKLYGTRSREGKTGGAHRGGLLEEMGYVLPSGRAHARRSKVIQDAIQDIEIVVCDTFHGIVGLKLQGEWIPFASWDTLSQIDLHRRALWYFFLPENWREEQTRQWEKIQYARAERGETTHAWKTTKDPQEAQQARQALAESPLTLSQGVIPLSQRLREARQHHKITQATLAALFGVPQPKIALWERGVEPNLEGKILGKPIPETLAPLLLRWIEDGTAPTPDELAARQLARG